MFIRPHPYTCFVFGETIENFEWKVVDMMMTNFHMPRTTLLLMIQSFVGTRWRKLYEEAIAREYRMLSFGDAMLLARRTE